MNRAGFLPRFLAFLLDNIALSILAWVLSLVIVPLVSVADTQDAGMLGLFAGAIGLVLAIILILLQFIYFGWLWSTSGQTLGMKVVNIRVVRRNSQPLSFLRAGLRGTVGYWISGLIFGLGFIWAAFDGRKEAWHDKLFDTAVVST